MCIDVRILAAFTICSTSLIIAGMAAIDGQEDCDKKSRHWDNETYTYSALADTCKPLAYDEQYCLVDNDQWECMRQRAVMHDFTSCRCHKKDVIFPHECLYLEICAFTDPDLKCDKNYTCSVDEEDVINCTAPNLPRYTNHCRRSFIHCSRNENCYPDNFQTKYDEVLRDECGKNLTDAFGTNVTIYFIDQVHFNNHSEDFANIFVLKSANGDEDNPCIREGTVSIRQSSSAIQEWKIVVPILIVFIVVMLLSVGGWKFRKIRMRDNKKWDGLLNSTFESLFKKVISTEESSESVEGGSTDCVEIADPIPPGGIRLPSENEEVFETADSALTSNEITNTQPLEVNGMSQISGDTDRIRGVSYENSSYAYENLVHPSTSSVGSVFSNYSDKNDRGIVDRSCSGLSEDTSTVSGYSLKSSSALNGSESQSSSSGWPIPHSDRPFDGTRLDSISERPISETSNSHLIPNMLNHEANRPDSSSYLNSGVYPGLNDMDNPTYLL